MAQLLDLKYSRAVPDGCHSMANLSSSSAPGAPGIGPTWTSSAKDVVTTALGTSRVWVTLGYGILNEIYWPETGDPQVRDLGFIVAGASGWFEVKRVDRYRIALPEPYIPLPHVTHEGDGYRLVLEVVPDPMRDVVVISYHLIGDGVRLYACSRRISTMPARGTTRGLETT
jgi:glucoamylase